MTFKFERFVKLKNKTHGNSLFISECLAFHKDLARNNWSVMLLRIDYNCNDSFQ